MSNLMNGLNFHEYINNLEGEYKIQLQRSFEGLTLSEKTKTFFSELSEDIKIVIFAEGYCPDCTVLVPFIGRIQEINSKIPISILPREGNFDLLKAHSGESRVPTIMAFKGDMQLLGSYKEFPIELKNKMKNSSEKDRIELIKQFREGKFNDMIERDIIELFNGKE